METVNVSLAHRWYLGYALREPVPDHSNLSKIRSRYGLKVFQCFFEHIIELRLKAGLVWGKELYFDGLKVRANAAIDGLSRAGRCNPNSMSIPCLRLTAQRKRGYRRTPSRKRRMHHRTDTRG